MHTESPRRATACLYVGTVGRNHVVMVYPAMEQFLCQYAIAPRPAWSEDRHVMKRSWRHGGRETASDTRRIQTYAKAKT